MKILKDFLRGVYYFGVGFNATCNDVKDYLAVRGSRTMLTGAMTLALAAAIVVSTTACGSRKASAPDETSSVSESVSESSGDSASQESASQEDQAPVELVASATRYKPLDVEQLRTLLKEKRQKYQEESASRVPTAGNLDEWKKINSDVVGWLTIPDTNISYPVLYTNNTEYYTHRGYYKEQSKNGVIWFDEDTQFAENGDVTSTNGIIYGHNWTNCWNPIRVGDPQDIMFAQLAAYDYEDFGKEHPYVYVNTFGGNHKYQVFTAFYTDLSFPYYYAELPNQKWGIQMTMDDMIKQAIQKSKYDFGVTATAQDKIISLSTCTRVLGQTDQQRFVVMAKLVE